MPRPPSTRSLQVAPPRGAPPVWPAVAVFAVSLVINLLTCARTVTLVDSGELIVASARLGVAHPPGFPLYTMVGFLFSVVPVGSVAFRLAMMSAGFAALTAALVAMIVAEVAVWTDSEPPAKNTTSPVAAPAAAIVAGLSFAFSATFWGYATVAEVYTMTLALLACAIWLVLRWRRRDTNLPIPWTAGLALGLGLAVHHVTVIMAVPGLLAFVVVAAGRKALAPRSLGPAVVGATVGLLSYLYLPIAAARRPSLNWGDPTTLERFWWHVSARQYRDNLVFGDLAAVKQNLAELGRVIGHELTLVGVLAVLVGILWLWRRDRGVLLLVTLVSTIGIAYAASYDIAEDTEAYLLSTLMAAAIVLGSAVVGLLVSRRGHSRLVAVAAVCALALPAVNAARHWRSCDRSDDLVARHFVEDALAGVGPGGVLLTAEWQLYAPWLYLHHIEDVRPDVAMVNANLCRRSWYLERYLPTAFPDLMVSIEPEVRALLTGLDDWEHGRPHDPDDLTRRLDAVLDAMFREPLPIREAHLTLPFDFDIADGLSLIPHGLTMQACTGPPCVLPAMPTLHLSPFLGDPDRLTPVADTKVRASYVRAFENRARYLTLIGDAEHARVSSDMARHLRGE